MSRRKHVSMMTAKEIAYVRKLVNEKRTMVALGEHMKERTETRGLTAHDIRGALFYGAIIEVNIKNDFPRALMRGRGANKQGEVTCLVLDLRTGVIITSYKNKMDDTHETLDASIYTPDMDVIKEVDKILSHT